MRKPDDVAALSDEELATRCKHSDDICILDGERFFVRCTIPLPVHKNATPYSIGAWAEISQPDFERICDLWSEADQAGEPAIDGALANQIPLTTGSLGCRVAVNLVGPASRPRMVITDEACSIFREQKEGIPAHRASEYSGVASKRMDDADALLVVAEDGFDSSACPCCERPIRTYCGHITDGKSGDVCADYWLSIPEGHDGYFTVAISIAEGGNARVAVLVGEATQDGFTYHLQDREDSPWEDFGEYGAVMDRSEVLDDPAKPIFFRMVDAIAARDARLVEHARPYLDPA